MVDVTQQINAVQRAVGSRALEAGEARVATVAQEYAATVDDVWDACTNAERIARWFLPITGDLQVGGRYQLLGNAGGKVESCDPPRAFTATWEFGGEVSWIDVRLTATADGTLLTLEHTAHVDDERWAEFGPGAIGIGWDLTVMALALHLTSGASADPHDAASWMVSDEGRQFMTESSTRWCEASILGGTDREAARAAADRTTAAYTAAPAQ